MSEARNPLNGGGGGNGGGANALGGSPMGLPNDQGTPDRDGYPVPGLGRIQRGDTPFHTEHNYNKAMYNKLVSARTMLDRIREEMDRLSDMGDTVAPEDVIAAAGRVAGHGVPARELAMILSTMPTMAGQGLAAWVAQQDQAVTQQEQHVDMVREIAAFRMGVSAVRSMAADDMRGRAHQRAAAARQAAPAGPLGARPMAPPAPAGGGGLPMTQVMQVAQRPQEEGAGAGEAV